MRFPRGTMAVVRVTVLVFLVKQGQVHLALCGELNLTVFVSTALTVRGKSDDGGTHDYPIFLVIASKPGSRRVQGTDRMG